MITLKTYMKDVISRNICNNYYYLNQDRAFLDVVDGDTGEIIKLINPYYMYINMSNLNIPRLKGLLLDEVWTYLDKRSILPKR